MKNAIVFISKLSMNNLYIFPKTEPGHSISPFPKIEKNAPD